MFAAGRVVAGVGGAGMRSLVSSLIVRKSRTPGSNSNLYAAKVYVSRIALSNLCRFGASTRHRRMAVMAQVYSYEQSKGAL